jgi:regulator of protease activity HflC (stomatin/prohibitin superfamily)
MIFTFILLCVIALIGLSGIRMVDQQNLAIVETFGKYSRTLEPGLNWIVPLFQRVVTTMDLRVSQLSAEVDIKSKDNMFVSMPVHIMVRILPEHAYEAYYQLNNPSQQITTWVLNTLRASTASMELMALFEDRDQLAREMQQDLAVRMKDYGYEIVSVLIDQPSVSEEVQHAFNSVIASRREREAAVEKAEARRTLIMGEARAASEAQALRAKGLADARQILTDSLNSAVASAREQGVDSTQVMSLLLETSRLDAIVSASEHGKMIIMDVRNPAATLPAAIQEELHKH